MQIQLSSLQLSWEGGGGRNGHFKLLVGTALCTNVASTAYTIQTQPFQYAQHGGVNTAAAQDYAKMIQK